jgi:hypothetical protein
MLIQLLAAAEAASPYVADEVVTFFVTRFVITVVASGSPWAHTALQTVLGCVRH